jgi:sulfatase maturation enzyme AslB (radical SAM superfamily)
VGNVQETYVVHVTKLCNCECRYCYEQDKTSTYTWEEVKNTVDNIIKFRTSDSFHIEFLGGEPMIAWDYCKGVINYMDREHPEIHTEYTITTNGTIINDELIEMINNRGGINFAISLDGHPFANQFRVFKNARMNTYDTVVANIKTLLEHNVHPSVHMVTHPWNVGFITDSVKHLYGLGIRNFGIGTVESVIPLKESYQNRFREEMVKLSKAICNNEFTDGEVSIDLFNWIKPKEDVRSYIRDESGKVVAESYGRSGDDISHQDDLYNITRCDNDTETSDIIYNLRSFAYHQHHQRLKDCGLE